METQEFGNIKDFNDFEKNNDSKNYILASRLNDNYLQPIISIYNDTICSIYLEDNINTKDIYQGQKSSIFKISKLKEHTNPYTRCSYAPTVNLTDFNDYIELFDSEIDEDNKTIYIQNDFMRRFLCDLYDDKESLPFMAYNKGYAYGPFSIVNIIDNDKLEVEIFNDHKLHFGKYEIESSNIVEFKQNQRTERKIVLSSQFESLVQSYSKINFISLDELKERVINDVARHSNRYKPEILDELKCLMKDITSSSENMLLPSDFKRLEKVNYTSNEFVTQLSSLLEPQYKEVNNKIMEKQSDLESLEKEIEEKQKQKDELEQSFDKVQKENDKRSQKAKEERDELIDEIEKLNNKKDSIRTEEIERLETEFTNKNKELESLNRKISENEIIQDRLKGSISSLRIKFRKEQESANEVLSGLVVDKSYFDFLNGKDFTKERENEIDIKKYPINTLNDYIELRKEVKERLIKNGRNLDDYTIDNLLISIHQNILTIFAGLPGTGKTSLARLMCKSLTDCSRIREVSVGRGWTSQKDLIGFQNPLNNTFCAAPTNIFSLLYQLDYECQNNLSDDSPMAYIILDEANLSPMEHYWSSFYALSDSHATTNKPLQINLGQDKDMKYNNTIRFIGTINYDQTTEELSHRVLDRANIIRIKPDLFNGSMCKEDFDAINISFKQLRNFLKLFDFEQQELVLPTKFKQSYIEIKDIFYNDLNIYISPRIDIAISRYCAVAKDLMDDMRPLDFCVAQRLLPLINIPYSENKLDNLLKKIKDIFIGMENCISIDILTEIREKGKEYQAGYNYFMTLSNV